MRRPAAPGPKCIGAPFLNVTDPDVHADDVYPSQQDTDGGSGGACRGQQRNGNLLVEVVGCRPNGQEIVWQDVLTG